jgi:hypothetical protein
VANTGSGGGGEDDSNGKNTQGATGIVVVRYLI